MRRIVWSIVTVCTLAFAAWMASWNGAVLPQSAARDFYVLKGLVAVAAVVLVAVHMAQTWHRVETLGQRLRYMVLLLAVVVIAGGSTAQFDEGAPVYGRNIGGLLIAAVACVAMVVSIRDDRRRR